MSIAPYAVHGSTEEAPSGIPRRERGDPRDRTLRIRGMPSVGFAFPVQPGKEGIIREVSDALQTRRSEFKESRERAGVSLERAYLQKNPDGGALVVAYVEAKGGFGDIVAKYVTSDLDLDRYFVKKNSEATGIDFAAGPQGPEPELVGEWVASGSTSRQRGMAFVAPLQPGKTDAARKFAQEAYATRKAEMADSRSAIGLSREMVFLNQTPMGDMVVVYLEGADPVGANAQFAASQKPFDRWFKDRCKEIFPPFVNFDEPVPANEELFDSAQLMAAV
jgi:hypothetical protein